MHTSASEIKHEDDASNGHPTDERRKGPSWVNTERAYRRKVPVRSTVRIPKHRCFMGIVLLNAKLNQNVPPPLLSWPSCPTSAG